MFPYHNSQLYQLLKLAINKSIGFFRSDNVLITNGSKPIREHHGNPKTSFIQPHTLIRGTERVWAFNAICA